MDIVDRLLSRIKVTPSGCFEWQGTITTRGYGQISVKNWPQLVHRVSFETFRRPIPADLCVCHRCDNPKCINPAHLFLGTYRENMRDCIRKGRFKRGETSGTSKLTEDEVRAMRHQRSLGESHKTLAARFNICLSHCYQVINGTFWSHVQ